jgi:signal transduction histidine kinase
LSTTANSLSSPWWRLTALLAGLLVGALLYRWVGYTQPAAEPYRIQSMQLASLPSPDYALAAEAQFMEGTRPFQFKGRHGIARIRFRVDDPATADLALFIGRARDNYEIYLNGKLAMPAKGMLDQKSTLHGFHPMLLRLLPALLVKGDNALDVLVSRNATNAVLRDVHLGPFASLEPHYRHYTFLTHDNAELIAFLAGIVLVFALALTPVIRDRALLLVISIALLLFVLRELHSLWVNYPWPQMWRDIYLNLIAAWLWCACAAFINEWTSGPAALRRWLIGAATLAAMIDIGAYGIWICHEAYGVGSNVQAIFGASALAFMGWRITRHYARAPAAAWGEMFFASLGLSMALATILKQSILFNGSASPNSAMAEGFNQFGAMAIILFIAFGLARHGIGIYQMAALNNETLTRRVDEKERALQAQHEILRAQEAERTLVTERGRIMSDVHDGIGSQLLGLLIQARAPTARTENLVDGLQSALDDLYLVVDSLDATEGSLETALATFRARLLPRCEAAGVTLKWEIDSLQGNAKLSPTAILQVCRILQEAISNAMRHGKARTIGLTASREGTHHVLVVTDDGSGFDPASPRAGGRGLANMRKRAASIGASLDLASSTAGTTIRLVLA